METMKKKTVKNIEIPESKLVKEEKVILPKKTFHFPAQGNIKAMSIEAENIIEAGKKYDEMTTKSSNK